MTESELSKSKPSEIAIIAAIQSSKAPLRPSHFHNDSKPFLFDTNASTDIKSNKNHNTTSLDTNFFETIYQPELYLDEQVKCYLEMIWQLLESAGVTRDVINKNNSDNIVVYINQEPNFAIDTTFSDTRLSNYQEYQTIYESITNHLSKLLGLPSSCFLNERALPTSIHSFGELSHYLLVGDTQIAIILGVPLSKTSNQLQLSTMPPDATPWGVLLGKDPRSSQHHELPILAMVSPDSERPNKFNNYSSHILSPVEIPATAPELNHPELIVLSANTSQALQIKAAELFNHILDFIPLEKINNASSMLTNSGTLSLQDLAYTLQCGREAMGYRLAMVVNRLDELLFGLAQFLTNEGEATPPVQNVLNRVQPQVPVNLYRGHPNRNNQFQNLFSGSSGETMLNTLIETGELSNLALYWSQGGDISWTRIKRSVIPNKIHLPVYPFYQPSTHTQQNAEENTALSSSITISGIESDLTTIWQELLGRPKIGRHQNFFEIGGDSQLGMHMLSIIRGTIGADLPLNCLYEAQTIAKMSEQIVLTLALSSSEYSQDDEYEEGFIV
ncbi:phosphopantetheine-binding protein [Vibrio rhizosphaerae]|uniref:CurL C-terminal domain-containing protein n=1 Tax=Vibrio rhizosphaerae TaxID=398736 RepID=UPI00056E10EF|nr:phosphopantetheine-binding protein [Vibrio rhizosphaerae]